MDHFQRLLFFFASWQSLFLTQFHLFLSVSASVLHMCFLSLPRLSSPVVLLSASAVLLISLLLKYRMAYWEEWGDSQWAALVVGLKEQQQG